MIFWTGPGEGAVDSHGDAAADGAGKVRGGRRGGHRNSRGGRGATAGISRKKVSVNLRGPLRSY